MITHHRPPHSTADEQAQLRNKKQPPASLGHARNLSETCRRIASSPSLTFLILAPILTLPAIWAYNRIDCGLLGQLRTYLFADDAFYYYQVAWNIVHGHGVSFDGYNTTNGFQPLWLCALLPVFAIWAKHPALNVIIILQLVLMTVALIFLVGMFSRRKLALASACACCFALACHPVFLQATVHGLETSLYVCCFAIALWHLQRWERAGFAGRTSAVVAGLLLVLLNLARTDGLIFSALIIGFFIVSRNWSKAIRVGLPLAIVLGAYVSWNYFEFGSLLPVSGTAKRIYASFALKAAMAAGSPRWQLIAENFLWPRIHPELSIFGIMAIINVLILPYYIMTSRRVLSLFHVFLILKYVSYAIIYYGHAQYKWYWTVDFLGPTLFLAVLSTDVVDRLRQLRHISWAAVLALQLTFCAWLALSWTDSETKRWQHLATRATADLPPTNELELFYRAAEVINERDLPESFRLSANNCGVLGYFGHHPVTNLDGLINGRKRLAYIRRDGYNFGPYLDSEPGIDAYLDFIQSGAVSAYDQTFRDRDFVYVDVASVIEDRYGRSEIAHVGQLRLYVRRKHAPRFDDWICDKTR